MMKKMQLNQRDTEVIDSGKLRKMSLLQIEFIISGENSLLSVGRALSLSLSTVEFRQTRRCVFLKFILHP